MQHQHPPPKRLEDTNATTATATTAESFSHERIALADRLLVLALLVAGVVLGIVGDREHAGLLLAGALGALSPLGARAPGNIARALPLALGLGTALALSSCGPALTTEQRTALAIETQLCISNERAIVDRVGSTREDDERDLAAERARCDEARQRITSGGSDR